MNKREERFNNFIILIVIVIGGIFIGISLKAVNNQNLLTRASVIDSIKLIEGKELVKPQLLVIDGKCGSIEWIEHYPVEGLCIEGVVYNRRINENRLFWECRGSGGGKSDYCYVDQKKVLDIESEN